MPRQIRGTRGGPKGPSAVDLFFTPFQKNEGMQSRYLKAKPLDSLAIILFLFHASCAQLPWNSMFQFREATPTPARESGPLHRWIMPARSFPSAQIALSRSRYSLQAARIICRTRWFFSRRFGHQGRADHLCRAPRTNAHYQRRAEASARVDTLQERHHAGAGTRRHDGRSAFRQWRVPAHGALSQLRPQCLAIQRHGSRRVQRGACRTMGRSRGRLHPCHAPIALGRLCTT